MPFLRGVETALAVVLMVDLIKILARPRLLSAGTKLFVVLVLSAGGAVALTPSASAWRDGLATAMCAMGAAMLLHELHSTLSTFVDTNIRHVLERAPRRSQVDETRRARSSRTMPKLPGA